MIRDDVVCDVLVIGAGLAGMAASLFALDKGLSVAQAGLPGESVFASGLLDLMAVSPLAEGRIWDDPHAAIKAEIAANPGHPYAKVSFEEIEAAFAHFTGFLAEAGLHYKGGQGKNSSIITPVGTLKHTYMVPEAMWNAVAAREDKASCLLVDFEGLKGFSARQIAETLGASWPELRHARMPFPGMTGDLYPEKMAFALEGPKVREDLAGDVRTLLKGEAYVGFPAVLGHYRPGEVFHDMEERLGVKVFEVPTMPPGVTGLRLKAAFEDGLPKKGLASLFQKLVLGYALDADGSFVFDLGRKDVEFRVRAKAAVLATGRFFGKGLAAGRETIREAVFDLPVAQPEGRASWHRDHMLDPAGHPINRAGLVTDGRFRPLGASSRPAFPNLYAAGSILANQDWMRMKCGAGVALASAYAAVSAIVAG